MTNGLEKAKKLTKAQTQLLQDYADDERGMTGVVSNYAPAKIMVANGFATWLRDDPYSERLIITPLGLSALQALDTGGGEV